VSIKQWGVGRELRRRIKKHSTQGNRNSFPTSPGSYYRNETKTAYPEQESFVKKRDFFLGCSNLSEINLVTVMEPQHKDFLILLSSDEIQQRVKQLAKQIERDILVEDIIDTGLTLSRLTSLLSKKRPRTLRIACLLNKPTQRRVPIEIDYT